MTFYRRFSEIQAASGSRGSAADAPDASLRLTENFLSAGGFKPTASDRIKAVRAFQEALTGKTTFSAFSELPPLEVTYDVSHPGDSLGNSRGDTLGDSGGNTLGDTLGDRFGDKRLDASSLTGSDLAGQMSGLMRSVLDVAMKLADPLAFIGAICEFLVSLFAGVSTEFAQALQQIEAYNQAAQAALDSEKLISNPTPD